MKLTDLSERRIELFTLHGKTENDVKDDLRILREWMSKLPHLPSDKIEDSFLEICLLRNKFSIEKCKTKIENFFTMKADPHFKYLYERIPVPSEEPSLWTPIPLLTEDYKRIFYFRIHNEEEFDMARDLNAVTIMREILQRFDYNDGELHIMDMRNCSTSIITKIRVNVFADINDLIMRGYSARVSALHIVSKIGKLIFSTVIPLLSKKLAGRIHFHDDLESLQKVVPSKCLPKDYGGNQNLLKEIIANWDEIYEENRVLIKKFIDTNCREELRIGDNSKKEEMKGTFRKLAID